MTILATAWLLTDGRMPPTLLSILCCPLSSKMLAWHRAISMWCASKKKENSEVVPEYKVGVEVKALFKKNHIDLLTLTLRLKYWKRRG